MIKTKPINISKYLNRLSNDEKKTLQELRDTILSCINKDEVEETFRYGIPTIKYKGKPLVGYGAFKNHLSFFIMTNSGNKIIKDVLIGQDFKNSVIHFTTENPLKKNIIKKILKYRVIQNDKLIERNKKIKNKKLISKSYNIGQI